MKTIIGIVAVGAWLYCCYRVGVRIGAWLAEKEEKQMQRPCGSRGGVRSTT